MEGRWKDELKGIWVPDGGGKRGVDNGKREGGK